MIVSSETINKTVTKIKLEHAQLVNLLRWASIELVRDDPKIIGILASGGVGYHYTGFTSTTEFCDVDINKPTVTVILTQDHEPRAEPRLTRGKDSGVGGVG